MRNSDTTKITGRAGSSHIARVGSTRDIQMAGGKHKNISNRSQGYLALSEPNSPTKESPGYPNTPEKARFRSKITSHDDDREH